nr:hypothetical protein Iba_chr14eCG1510 [Ipomoea batatas]
MNNSSFRVHTWNSRSLFDDMWQIKVDALDVRCALENGLVSKKLKHPVQHDWCIRVLCGKTVCNLLSRKLCSFTSLCNDLKHPEFNGSFRNHNRCYPTWQPYGSQEPLFFTLRTGQSELMEVADKNSIIRRASIPAKGLEDPSLYIPLTSSSALLMNSGDANASRMNSCNSYLQSWMFLVIKLLLTTLPDSGKSNSSFSELSGNVPSSPNRVESTASFSQNNFALDLVYNKDNHHHFLLSQHSTTLFIAIATNGHAFASVEYLIESTVLCPAKQLYMAERDTRTIFIRDKVLADWVLNCMNIDDTLECASENGLASKKLKHPVQT